MSLFPSHQQAEPEHWRDWRWQMANAATEVDQLLPWLTLTAKEKAAMAAAAGRFPMLATPYYLSLAQSSTPRDPILRQCLPSADELGNDAGVPDPLGEEANSPLPGLVHRYADRALLILTSACATRCRHCLRKRLWDHTGRTLSRQQVKTALNYVAEQKGIREIILSGGDPLLLDEEFLDGLLAAIFQIGHVEIVRIGSRLPVVLPQRLTPEFCATLGRHGPVWLATHFNHPHELTEAAAGACLHMLKAGVPVLNQTVLLKGVNDDAEVIRRLNTGLLRMRVKPYYLFHGDPVAGASHFRTGIAAGLEILDSLRGATSGLAVPTFAIDLPEGGGKVPLTPDYAAGTDPNGHRRFVSAEGRIVSYPEPR